VEHHNGNHTSGGGNPGVFIGLAFIADPNPIVPDGYVVYLVKPMPQYLIDLLYYEWFSGNTLTFAQFQLACRNGVFAGSIPADSYTLVHDPDAPLGE
jgi:hypothetical protein